MAYCFYQNQTVEISYSKKYSVAVFGINHAAFLGNDRVYYFPMEDKASIEASLSFYKKFILADAAFPVYDGKNYSYVKSDDKQVIGQILGLPDVVFSSLDLTKDILPQLRFSDDLSKLKKRVYQEEYRSRGKKYFCDDFRMYCRQHGLFFLYEETKPFVHEDHSLFPVYYDESRLSKDLSALIGEATSERFLIDFPPISFDETLIEKRKPFDSFPFLRRLSYFVNGKFDAELSDLNKDASFRKEYSLLLRRYFASLINYLYDRYCFEVLNKVTTKVSYLTPCKVFGKVGRLYAISSFNGERYTTDFKHYFFDSNDRDLIKALREKNYYVGEDTLSFYAKLGLPYQGYLFLKGKKVTSVDSCLSLLPFQERKGKEAYYLSVKRYDFSYSFLPEEKEHKYVFSYRRLLKNGIYYSSSKPVFSSSPDNRIRIAIYDYPRENTPLSFIDQKQVSLTSWPLFAYLMARDLTHDTRLKDKLAEIDEKSNGTALYEFFRLFHQNTLLEVLSYLFSEYSLTFPLDDKVKDFFSFLLTYPFLAVEALFRNEARRKKDSFSLRQLDGDENPTDRYEPNLPYPYVSYGSLCYSFRKDRYSKAYVCSCQKKAIESKLNYEIGTAGRRRDMKKRISILNNLGLPLNVIEEIDPFSDIKSQIKYKDGICHLCNHSTPSYYSCCDDNQEALYNVYLTYIQAKAAEKGVYSFDSFSQLTEPLAHLHSSTFASIGLELDEGKVDPILKPYLRSDGKSIISLLSSFYGPDFFFSTMATTLQNFRQHYLDLGSRDSLNQSGKNELGTVMLRLLYIYHQRGMAYGVWESSSFLSRDDSPFTLGMDYNPKLPHPYVFLGRHYNAYGDDPLGRNMAFCLCDKETRRKERKYSYQRFDFSYIPSAYQASVLLGLIGLPYLRILKFQDVDLSLTSLDELRNRIPFKECIGRRCLNITHCSYSDVFTKAFPLKANSLAEFTFAVNGRLHDGFSFVGGNNLSRLRYRKNHFYDLESDYDSLLPCINRLDGSAIPEAVFSFFSPGEDKVKDYLYDYLKVAEGNAEINAYASGIIQETYKKDSKCLLKFVSAISTVSYRENLLTNFPDVKNVRPEILNDVLQSRLGFFTFLYERLIKKYVEKEKRIGR